ncbi:dTMP kinase [Anaerolineales bacterium HSG24]|nr:dTMP kinase [Anaerolineales bacterium HSG24]
MGLFITFEGTDGSGKTTQIQQLTAHLETEGRIVCTTREPGGTKIGNQIRHVLHDVNNIEMTAEAEILLYSASRAQLVRELVLPRLAQGEVVLCDRYVESTYAYQGYGRELNFDMLRRLGEFATQGVRPDLIIYLDLDIQAGLARKATLAATGQEVLNRMDKLEQDFYQRVRDGYHELARQDSEPTRWLILDASAPIETISQQVWARVSALLESVIST